MTDIEVLAAKFHDIYQQEAKRQGDVRHKDAYTDLPENIKEFDRVLARYVQSLLAAQLQAAAEHLPLGLTFSEPSICNKCGESYCGLSGWQQHILALNPSAVQAQAEHDAALRREYDDYVEKMLTKLDAENAALREALRLEAYDKGFAANNLSFDARDRSRLYEQQRKLEAETAALRKSLQWAMTYVNNYAPDPAIYITSWQMWKKNSDEARALLGDRT